MNKSVLNIQSSYTQELNFEQAINSHIAQFWSRREEGFIQSFDKTQLFWIKLTSAKHHKAIVLVNGRIECTWKYQELFYDLFQQGYNIYSFDHRGQGLSDRLIDDIQMGYVEEFDDYVHDLHHLMQHFNLEPYERCYLMGHSMGGNIATRYLQTYPNHPFSAVALSAPMFGVNLPWHLKLIAIPFAQIMTALSTQPSFAPGQQDYYPKPFENNFLTQSYARYQWFRNLYEQKPELKIGGASNRWVWQGLMAAKKCHLMARHIKIPLLLLQAGNDKIVSNHDQSTFFKKLAKNNFNCVLKHINHSRHEILFEKDEYRNQALDTMLTFFDLY
ncbi:alpha/beta fold hydrolase [Vibrio pectenicida]|uniref:Alpha/beta fold hydrolase n=1 Tax=Vibrio pectenicida TaxID=62763 RepID=A0A7Y4EF52_9VIBR|nr:alpha/beta fold hydrolase [Vibrio pectenicida]NOH72187.1 alpha/beta fold hydrolase [Vibrio pectenicida]